mgnify:FL=1
MKLLRTLTFSSIIAGCITGCGSDSDNELADLSGSKKFTLEEATIADLQDAFKYKKVITDTGKPATCENVAEAYLSRIDMYDKKESTEGKSFQSIIAINPTWRDQAKELDRRYSSGGPVGRLHCVPVLLKDLYDTYDFPTTSSSLALLGSQPPDDAFTVSKLRAQGSLILGKTTMTEFAFFTQSYNSRTGRVGNAYDPEKDAGGSSGGSAAAVALNFGLVGTGSDTCASIRLPPSNQSLVGIRPSVGLLSQDGLIPLSHSQDVPGPIARTVKDAVTLLDIMAEPDSSDPKTLTAQRPFSYMESLRKDGLQGKRIGVLRSYGRQDSIGNNEDVNAVFDNVINKLKEGGAEIVDDVRLPDFESTMVILEEFPDDLDLYLSKFDAPVKTTEEVSLSGDVHPFINTIILASLAARLTPENVYLEKISKREEMRVYVEEKMDEMNLDALVYPPVRTPPQPTGILQPNNCEFGSTTSQPSIVVPAGFTSDEKPLPIGVEFLGRKWDEKTIIEIAYGFEQATKYRKPPEVEKILN